MRPPYDGPGVYVIHIDGRLDESWTARLGGLTITKSEADEEGGRPVTVLKGDLPDQAALLGVLNVLYNNRYPVTFVRYLRPSIAGAPVTSDQEQPSA
ncbi:MAG: hypothetical protein ACK2UK_09570 [Candidatus Promineifilaceae bacterium]